MLKEIKIISIVAIVFIRSVMRRPENLIIKDCECCASRANSIFHNLLSEELQHFICCKSVHIFEKHQVLFYEGKPSLCLYLLCSGKVKLIRSSRFGQQQIIKIVQPGEIIGHELFLRDGFHALTCEVMERSQICIIEKKTLLDIFRRKPEVAINMVESLSRQMEELEHKLSGLTFKKAEARIAEVLVGLTLTYGKKTSEGVLIDIPLKREEIAEMSGTSLETVVRFISRMKDKSVLLVRGKEIVVRDGDTLSKLVG